MKAGGVPENWLEQDVVDLLVGRLLAAGMFTVYTEAAGLPRSGGDPVGRPRADILMVPTGPAVAWPFNWCDGAVGLELKKPGINLTKAVDQVIDYQTMPWSTRGGVAMVVDCWYIGPVAYDVKPDKDLAMLMGAHRIGLARVAADDGSKMLQLAHVDGNPPLLTLSNAGDSVAVTYNPTNGRAGVRCHLPWRCNP